VKSLFIAEWLIGMGIIAYRAVKDTKAPPMPGQLLAASVLFAVLGLIAEGGEGAERTAALLGGGLDIAAFMGLFERPAGNQSTAGVKLPANLGAGS